MSNLTAIAGLITAVIGILGYIGWVVRKIATRLRAWEKLVREHAVLMDAAHYHEHGRIIPLAYYQQPRSHRRRADWS